jgi:hypothetical protein
MSEERLRPCYKSPDNEFDENKEPKRVSRRRLKELIYKIAYPRRRMLNYQLDIHSETADLSPDIRIRSQ